MVERYPPSPPHHIWIIANPGAGCRRGSNHVEAIARRWAQHGIRAQVHWTRCAGDASRLAHAGAAAGADAMAVFGGDGTVRDVVEGLVEASDVPKAFGIPPLAILPGGTGNDLARALGIPRDPLAAADLLRTGVLRDLDLWRWNDRIFLDVAGVGLDAAVARIVNERLRSVRGPLAYLLGVLLTLARYRPVALEIRTAGEGYRGRAMLAAFANARCYGGGMQIAPQADPTDGLLDVVVVEAVSKLELLRCFPRVFRGTHLSHPRIRCFRAAEVEVRCEPPAPATLDGELIGDLPATIRHAGVRVRVYVPAS